MFRNLSKDTTPRIPVIAMSEYLPYYDSFGYYHPWTHHITDGYRDFRVRGKVRGLDLCVDCRGCDVTRAMPSSITDHAGAVTWCRRQLGETEVAA